jgi:hypothetical protein
MTLLLHPFIFKLPQREHKFNKSEEPKNERVKRMMNHE